MAVHRWPVHCIAADTISGNRTLEVGRGVHVHRILAAQLELDRDQVAAGSGDRATGGGGPGEGDGTDPVGWPTSADPVTPRSPHTTFRTPAGSPASAPRSARWSADRGAFIRVCRSRGSRTPAQARSCAPARRWGSSRARSRARGPRAHATVTTNVPAAPSSELLARGAYRLPGHELDLGHGAVDLAQGLRQWLAHLAVAVAATSVLWPARRPAQRPRTRDCSNGEAAAHAGPAASAADTAALMAAPSDARTVADHRPCRGVGHGRGSWTTPTPLHRCDRPRRRARSPCPQAAG